MFPDRLLVYPINRDTFHGSFGSIEAGYCRMAASPVVLCGEAGINLGRARGTSYAFTTSAQPSRAARSLPTLKVIQVPRPTIGSASPVDGMGFVASVGAFEPA